MDNKRAEDRFRSRGFFTIYADGNQPIEAKLLDTSPSGLGLDAPCELASGTVVQLYCGDLEIGKGTVQHCKSWKDRFVLGIFLHQ
jgi:PilZ domain